MPERTISQGLEACNLNTTQKMASHLRLASSNPNPVKRPDTNDAELVPFPEAFYNPTNSMEFSTKVVSAGVNKFMMEVVDPSNYLLCNLALEVQAPDGRDEGTAVACQFPAIDERHLCALIWGDPTLYTVISTRFHMKILGQLLQFCIRNQAMDLHILVDENQADTLEIYRNFTTGYQGVSTLRGRKVRMTLPATPEVYEQWVDFMATTFQGFGQTLWREQASSAAIRHYLKTRPLAGQLS